MAISVVEELVRRSAKKPLQIYWIGARSAMEGKSVTTLESSVLPKLGVTTHLISAGRLQRRFNLWTVPSLAKIPLGFVQAAWILAKIRPDIVLSFGGFAAFPCVFWGWVMGIPVVLHEQTIAAGRANRLSAHFAKKIAVAREESLKYFPRGKCALVGNPIMTQIAETPPKTKLGSPPTLFVTGGSRGSQTINALIRKILPELLQRYIVVHQTGQIEYAEFAKLQKELPGGVRQRYEVYAQIDPMQIDGVYKRADVLVGRSGASTVSEVLALHLPSIFIPIPFSYEDEQTKNARYAKRLGTSEILGQEAATPETLLALINKTFSKWDAIVARTKTLKSPDKDASSRLVDLVLGMLR
jgi:UDP-N-acetylglucosamine--N-acetylmuramyl-(pentapeptide) pyrophosphoryl-undecaprenol N-acetylglucosamine transferase